MWARFFALSSSNFVRRTTTSWRKSTKLRRISLRERVRGRPFTRATLLNEKLDCSGVYLNRVFSTTPEFTPCLRRITTRIPSRELSSLI